MGIYTDENETFSTLFTVIFIVLFIGGCYHCSNKKEEKSQEIENATQKMKESGVKLQDTLHKIEVKSLKDKYNAIGDIPDDIKFSYELENYIKESNLFIKDLTIGDIIKKDSTYLILSEFESIPLIINVSHEDVSNIKEGGKILNVIVRTIKTRSTFEISNQGKGYNRIMIIGQIVEYTTNDDKQSHMGIIKRLSNNINTRDDDDDDYEYNYEDYYEREDDWPGYR